MLSINISELVFTVINFFLLLFLLKRFLYAPLIRFMDARNARIAAGLDAEKEALAAAEESERLLTEKKKASMAQAKRIVEQAQSADERRREQLVDQARRDAEETRGRAKKAARELQKAEAQRLKTGEAELAALLADRLLCGGYVTEK